MCPAGVAVLIFSLVFMGAAFATLYHGFGQGDRYAEARPLACIGQAVALFFLALLPWGLLGDGESPNIIRRIVSLIPHDYSKMSPSEWIVLSMVLLVLVLIARPYWRRRISRWANGRGFTLKSFRVLPFWERGAFSSRHQFWFEVTLEDKRGNIHKAHVCFGSFWGLNPTKVEVEWLREGPSIDDLTQEALTKKAARMANQMNAQKDVFKSRW